MRNNKPITGKNYGSIGHLPNSRTGPADHCCPPGMARIATEKRRNKYDRVIVQEKLDGTNVGVVKVNDEIYAIQRAGYLANTSPYPMHHYFAKWVEKNKIRFYDLLQEGERVCGEWLIKAHGTIYELPHEPFVDFDLMVGKKRKIYVEFYQRVSEYDFVVSHLVQKGDSISVEDAMVKLGEFGFHGAKEKAEGLVYRVETKRLLKGSQDNEREWVVDFLCKYVRPDKIDGCYLDGDPVWNVNLDELL